MEDYNELKTFIKIWFAAIVSLCYCYFIPNRISNGFRRLLSLLPIITVFFILPLPLSVFHLAGPTVFYLVWLGNFKLLLFAFNRGPLASTRPLKLIDFISIALLPINPKHAGNESSGPDLDRNPDPNPVSDPSHKPISINHKHARNRISDSSKKPIPVNPKHAGNRISGPISDSSHIPIPINAKHAGKRISYPDPIADPSHKPILLAVKALILAVIVIAYQYRDNLNRNVILGFYCVHVYLGVELILALTAFVVNFILRFDFEIESQFNEPYLSTSLQDFWGRRWNLMVTRILRPSVYDPVREILTPLVGKMWSRLPAIFATFMVSGLMHELIYFYFTRVRPTWEVTWFFVVHGVCTAIEVVVKKVVNGRFRVHRAVSGVVTVAFVAMTGVWLFLPQILRNGVDAKAINEYSVVVNFLKSKLE